MTLNSSENLEFENDKLIEFIKKEFMYNEFSLSDQNSKIEMHVPKRIKKLRSEKDTLMKE